MAETAEDRTEDRATGRGWPGYLFGGRVRTSTIALILAFVVIWWAYESYGPAAETPEQVPAAEVVPPGFIPDPAYTWVPRTEVQRSPATTSTTPTTPTTTSSVTPTSSPPTSASTDDDVAVETSAETSEPVTTTAVTPSPSAAPTPATTPAATPATTPAATPATPTS